MPPFFWQKITLILSNYLLFQKKSLPLQGETYFESVYLLYLFANTNDADKVSHFHCNTH